ncbi:MAG: hypothetical protein GY859_36380 [Desulfobacterales bacterium]|nr:hypothetical protein [Desulfobacterales bacterium]
MEVETVRRFCQARHDAYVSSYEFFVRRIDAGDLAGDVSSPGGFDPTPS